MQKLAMRQLPPDVLHLFSMESRPGRFGDPACFVVWCGVEVLRACFRFLPSQHLPQGFYCLCVCFV